MTTPDATRMTYTVRHANENALPELSADWDAPAWQNAMTARLLSFREESQWFGVNAQVRLLHDDDYIYGIFKVEDKYMQSTHGKTNTYVCQDACVEFFFSPDCSESYFNVEMNNAGVVYASHNVGTFSPSATFSEDEIASFIKTKGSVPYLVETEIEGPITWCLEFRIDKRLVEKDFGKLPKNLSGQVWTGNFYHCNDHSSHPRWVSWSQVPKLAFHLPLCFGNLVFE